jgi:hypothetical protein
MASSAINIIILSSFTGQTAAGISMKLHMSGQYNLELFIMPTRSTLLHKMPTIALNRNISSCLHKSICWWDLDKKGKARQRSQTATPVTTQSH